MQKGIDQNVDLKKKKVYKEMVKENQPGTENEGGGIQPDSSI
jgi:hypothetical protein